MLHMPYSGALPLPRQLFYLLGVVLKGGPTVPTETLQLVSGVLSNHTKLGSASSKDMAHIGTQAIPLGPVC